MSQASRILRAAWRKSGKSLEQLKSDAGLKLTNASMSRKLAGKQPMSIREAAKLAAALGLSVTAVPESIVISKPADAAKPTPSAEAA